MISKSMSKSGSQFFMRSTFNKKKKKESKSNLTATTQSSLLKRHKQRITPLSSKSNCNKLQLQMEMQNFIESIEKGKNFDQFIINIMGTTGGKWQFKFIADGQTIWDQQTPGNIAIIVLQGKIDLFVDVRDKNYQICNELVYIKSLHTKEFFVDESLNLIKDSNFKTRAVAKEPSSLLFINKQDYLYYYRKNTYVENKEKFQVINQVDIIHDLNPELTFEKRYDIFHHLYQHMTKIVVSENQSVYLEGSTIEHVYIIKSGLFEFSKKMIHNDQNYQIKLLQINEGVFGLEEVFLNLQDRIQSIKCMSYKGYLYRISKKDWEHNFCWYYNKNYSKIQKYRSENLQKIVQNFKDYLERHKEKNNKNIYLSDDQLSSQQIISLNTQQQKSMLCSFSDVVNDKLDVIRYRQSMTYKTTGDNEDKQKQTETPQKIEKNINYMKLIEDHDKQNDNKQQKTLLLDKYVDNHNKLNQLQESDILLNTGYIKQKCQLKVKKKFEDFQENYFEKFKTVTTDYNDYNFLQYQPEKVTMDVQINYKKLKGLHDYTVALQSITDSLFRHSNKVMNDRSDQDLKMRILRPKLFL